VTGPPGSGRSALLNAVCESPAAAGCTVLRAAGAAAERNFAFGVVQQLFQPLLSSRSTAEVDAWLGGPAGPARTVLVDDPWSAGHLPSETVLYGLHALLLNASADRPVLLVVDDVQWADTASLTWLGYLARRLHRSRVLVVCAVTSPLPAEDSPEDSAESPAEDSALLRELVIAPAGILRPDPLSARAV